MPTFWAAMKVVERKGVRCLNSWWPTCVTWKHPFAESDTMELLSGKPLIDAYSKRSKNLLKKVLFFLLVDFDKADLELAGRRVGAKD